VNLDSRFSVITGKTIQGQGGEGGGGLRAEEEEAEGNTNLSSHTLLFVAALAQGPNCLHYGFCRGHHSPTRNDTKLTIELTVIRLVSLG
jgi:hypothetical protein